MSTLHERFVDNITAITPLLILGAGFIALFAGFDYFYLIWILGFVVVVPIIAILFDDMDDFDPFQDRSKNLGEGMKKEARSNQNTEPRSSQQGALDEESTTDALSTLRERYASGDLTDAQFEQKLDRLLETETPEDAVEWRERTMREVETERSE